MNKIKVAKELIKLAKNLIALDEQGDGSGFQILHDHENAEQEIFEFTQRQGKKYILHHKEGNLWRIQACKNFGDVKKGDFGGLIESEKNLSHDGKCWVYDNVKVYDNAQVYGNAKVYDDAQIYDNAKVYGNFAIIRGDSNIHGQAKVNYAVYDSEVTE